MFILEAAKKYKDIWAIAAFSESTIERTLSILQIKHTTHDVLNIVELGSWEWGFTTKLCEGFPYSTIHAFEINQTFIRQLQNLPHPNLTIYPQSAEYIHQYIHDADVVISTLPFTIFDDQKVVAILQSIQRSIKANGILIIIQYSNMSNDLMVQTLGKEPIFTDRSLKNIPPAKLFVFTGLHTQ